MGHLYQIFWHGPENKAITRLSLFVGMDPRTRLSHTSVCLLAWTREQGYHASVCFSAVTSSSMIGRRSCD